MTNERGESRWERDKRMREEEARMVRLEDTLTAQKEIMQAAREDFRVVGEAVANHASKDEDRFASVDNRLMSTTSQLSGIQAQLSTISQQLGELVDQKKIQNGRLDKAEQAIVTTENAIWDENGFNRIEHLTLAQRDADTVKGVWKGQLAFLFSGGGALAVIIVKLILTLIGISTP